MRNAVSRVALALSGACLIAGTPATTQERRPIDEKALVRARELVAQAKACVKEGKYDLAARAAEEALKIEPSGVFPSALRDEARAWKVIAESHEKLRKYPAPAIERMIEDCKAERPPAFARLIETADRITEWLDLCEGRKSRWTVAGEEGLKRVQEQLEKRVTMEFRETSFDNVIEFLMDLTGENFEVDAEAKRRQRIGPDTTITFKAVNLPLDEALKAILSQVNLEYEIGPKRIVFTDAQGLKRPYEIRVYDVRDLVHAMSGQPYIGFGMDNNNGPAKPNETAAAHLEGLVRLIRNATAAESWQPADPGSRTPSIQTFREQMLIVVQTPQVHGRIRYLLTWLRAYLEAPKETAKTTGRGDAEPQSGSTTRHSTSAAD